MSTEELTNKLKSYENINDFLEENQAEFNEDGLQKFLDIMLQCRNMTLPTLALQSGISVPYIYNLYTGRKSTPRKDILLRLAFGLSLNPDEANRLLVLGGVSPLRAKMRRDSIIIFCLENGHSIMDADELLLKYGLAAVSSA